MHCVAIVESMPRFFNIVVVFGFSLFQKYTLLDLTIAHKNLCKLSLQLLFNTKNGT